MLGAYLMKAFITAGFMSGYLWYILMLLINEEAHFFYKIIYNIMFDYFSGEISFVSFDYLPSGIWVYEALFFFNCHLLYIAGSKCICIYPKRSCFQIKSEQFSGACQTL